MCAPVSKSDRFFFLIDHFLLFTFELRLSLLLQTVNTRCHSALNCELASISRRKWYFVPNSSPHFIQVGTIVIQLFIGQVLLVFGVTILAFRRSRQRFVRE